jgi:hypothetical protein
VSASACTCGEFAPHIIARRKTADDIAVEFWHDGAITGRMGFKLPGVPVVRPRTDAAVSAARAVASLVAGQVELHELAELPRLVDCARRVAARGGSPGDLRAAFAATGERSLTLTWDIYATDRTGKPTVRVAKLDRIRWPGLVVWHERGRYELLALRNGTALGAHNREALHTTGFSFESQRALFAHLFSLIRPE